MNTFIDAIQTEQKRIQRVIDLTAPSENKPVKKSCLTLDPRNGTIYCYAHRYHSGKRIEKKYLGTLTSKPVQDHVADRICAERLRKLQSNQQLLQRLEKSYQNDSLEAILSDLPRAYRRAVNAISGEQMNRITAINDASYNYAAASNNANVSHNNAATLNNANAARNNANVSHNNTATLNNAIAARNNANSPHNYSNASHNFFNERYEELRSWANADYERNSAPFPESETYTKNGRRVRSKGECIFCNIYDELGVLYRYDSVIYITDSSGRTKKLSPDFLIQCFDGSLIIIEHLGWYAGLKYGIDFGEKCYWYLQDGFILGKNFFATSDDAYGGTDSQAIFRVACQVERMFFGY